MQAHKLISILAVASALTACASVEDKISERITAEGATPLTAAEIRTTLTGNSVFEKFKTAKGNPAKFTGYYKDSVVLGRSWGSGWDEKDQAIWRATKNNEYCRSWKKWRDGKEGCFTIYRLSDTELAFVAVSGSAKSGIAKLETGNPYSF